MYDDIRKLKCKRKMKRKVLYRALKTSGTGRGKPLEAVHSTLGKVKKQEIKFSVLHKNFIWIKPST
jgi:DNA-binding phage protein